jgi:hypothetical protein
MRAHMFHVLGGDVLSIVIIIIIIGVLHVCAHLLPSEHLRPYWAQHTKGVGPGCVEHPS